MKCLHKEKPRKESSQQSKTRGAGSPKPSLKNVDSELDTNSGSESESDPEDNVPLDFDALDSGSNGEDVMEDNSASGDEDDTEPPFSDTDNDISC